jgi:formamidopyrimidine-DNA glycosylase
MPELPEVETIARALRQENGRGFSIVGSEIEDVSVLWERSIAIPSAVEFKQRMRGQHIQEVGRRGKYIVVTLTQDTLLIHLRMSGDLRIEPGGADFLKNGLRKHDRVAFTLSGGNHLIFEDARKFGRVWLLADPQEELGTLGPEPLGEELDAQRFYAMLHDKKRQLKPLLMDQHFLAGMGNIYTDEALFKARIHPLTNARDLSAEQAAGLLSAIRETLQEGIARNGSSIDWVYRGGDFQNHFAVYGRTGEACPVCGATIERLVVGQRGTHICPHCQMLPSGDK